MIGAGGVLPVGFYLGGRPPQRSPVVPMFERPLPIPPVLQPAAQDESTDFYAVTQRSATAEVLTGFSTEIWGYDGIFPGPTIEARRGRTVQIDQTNDLPVPVVVHLHGGVTPPASDGYPTDMIMPLDPRHAAHQHVHAGGDVSYGVRTYTYPNVQRAATLWYHDHRMDFTGPQVYRGLAGMYIIRDEIEDLLPLPFGEREIPLVITDRVFNDDGSFWYPSRDPSLLAEPGVTGSAQDDGLLGDVILVNGAPWPVLDVANVRYRFRVLNASNARVYDLGLDSRPDDGDSFVQIGSDGGLLERPVGRNRIRISPGERMDLVVDFGRYRVGDTITLRNFAVEDPLGRGRISQIMQFRITSSFSEESFVPDVLSEDTEAIAQADAVRTRRFQFSRAGGMWTINGRPFDMERIWADPTLDDVEIWEFSGSEHPVHLHLAHFKVLARNGGGVHQSDVGWKDTVFLDGGLVRVLAKFSGFRGKYVFHCHNLEHEDHMMMANFEVK